MRTSARAQEAALRILADRARDGLATTADDVRVAFSQVGVLGPGSATGVFRRAQSDGLVHPDPEWRPRRTRDGMVWLPGRADADRQVPHDMDVPAAVPSHRKRRDREWRAANQPGTPLYPVGPLLTARNSL